MIWLDRACWLRISARLLPCSHMPGAKVACPTTLIVGASDQMTPPKATKELAAALQARVVTVASGHHLMAEAPDAVLAGLRGALAAA